MIEVKGDLFEPTIPRNTFSAVCITTNGVVNGAACAVMGKGVALEAKQRWPGIEVVLGARIIEFGNHTRLLSSSRLGRPKHAAFNGRWFEYGERVVMLDQVDGAERHQLPFHLIALPTKHDWRQPSPPELVERSIEELVEIADANKFKHVALPRPGCANGGLRWADVKPILQRHLDDRFLVFDRNP